MSRLLVAVIMVMALAKRTGAEPTNPCPDPGCRIKSPSTLTTVKGSILVLPPGYFLDEPTWALRDSELKDAQNKVTRLKAENESFRKDADKFSWAPVVGSVIGVVGSVLLYVLVK